MVSRIQSLGSFLIIFALLLFAGSVAAQDVTPRCEAAMDRAAGDYSRCLLHADAHYARHGNVTKLHNRQTHCQTRFDRRTTRARSRYGADECTATDLVAAIAERTVSYAEDVSLEARGLDDPPVQNPCPYPTVGGLVFSGTQNELLFTDEPPEVVPQTYTFGEQYGEKLVRANISAPNLHPSLFPVICGYSPKSSPTALPMLICVEDGFDATRNVYVTDWTPDCVAKELEVIGYEPHRFVGQINLTRTDAQ